MKQLFSSILVFVILVLSITKSFAAEPVFFSNSSNDIDISVLSEQELSQNQIFQIQEEMDVLSDYIDIYAIDYINATSEGNEYSIDYGGINETVLLEVDDNENITIMANDGEKSNVISFEADGDIVLDGKQVIFESDVNISNSNILVGATIWKGVKSLSPYGSLKASDYNNYLSSGKDNVALQKQLNELTVTVFSALIGSLHPYLGIAVSLATVAKSVYDTFLAVNPQTKTLGCAWTTYTCGAMDYKYINKFYANSECTGSYRQEISYEHFIVY